MNQRSALRLAWGIGVLCVACVIASLVLLVLGAMHFFNLYVFSRIRRSAQGPRRPVTPPPPVAPDAVLNVAIPR